VGGETGRQVVVELGEGEGLDLRVAECGDLRQGAVEILLERSTHGVELDRQLIRVGHASPRTSRGTGSM
jgi:hypothetical protein